MKNKKVHLFMAVLLVGAFAVVATMGSAVNVSAKSEKSEKSSSKKTEVKNAKVKVETRSKVEKKQEFKTYEAATTTSDKGNGNAQVHQKKIAEVTTELDAAGEVIEVDPTATTKKNGKMPGNMKKAAAVGAVVAAEGEEAEEVEEEEQEPEEVLEEVAETQEEMAEETSEAIEAVESRGALKKMIIGDDYKNLGQLRSTLVHSRNDVKKLTRTLAVTEDPEAAAALEEAITTLMQERARIRTVIDENEGAGSLFGWLGRFMTGYQDDGVEDWDETEESLADIAAEAIEEAEEQEAEDAQEAAEESAEDEDGTEEGDDEDAAEEDGAAGTDEEGTTTGDDDATEDDDDATSDQTGTSDDDDTETGTETGEDEDPTTDDDTTGAEDPTDPII